MSYITVNPEDQTDCQHEHIEHQSSGGWHFSDDGPWDDIKEVDICLDCGCEVKPAYEPILQGEELPL